MTLSKRHYYAPKRPVSLKRPKDLYKCWLSGQSLRSLGREIGCSHNTVAAVLKRKYGDKATNLVARSLERTLVQDYGLSQIEYAFKLATQNPDGDGQKHRSKHNLRQLTQYQSSGRDHVIETVSSLDAMQAQEEAQEREEAGAFGFLRLPFFQVLTGTIAEALKTLDIPLRAA